MGTYKGNAPAPMTDSLKEGKRTMPKNFASSSMQQQSVIEEGVELNEESKTSIFNV